MTLPDPLRAQLQSELALTEWESLRPHAQRDGLIVVEPRLDLVEAGAAIAADLTETVQDWISAGLIRKPSAAELGQWNQDGARSFQTLIVQPYVLIQVADPVSIMK
ncbi:MAG: DUF2288 family protein [Cyanobacteria bacterium RI_101]|nr:DUF2288 family protein [Cyanobacteria bacterium RI_101]